MRKIVGQGFSLAFVGAYSIRPFVISFIKCYCKLLSPFLPSSCKFHPTCSNYTIEAMERYGVLHGIALGIWRVLRCNPWNSGGCDPVP